MKMNQEVYKIVKHLADQYANALLIVFRAVRRR